MDPPCSLVSALSAAVRSLSSFLLRTHYRSVTTPKLLIFLTRFKHTIVCSATVKLVFFRYSSFLPFFLCYSIGCSCILLCFAFIPLLLESDSDSDSDIIHHSCFAENARSSISAASPTAGVLRSSQIPSPCHSSSCLYCS